MPVAVGERTGSVIRAVLVSLFFFQVSCKTLRVDEPPVEEQAEEGIWARSGPWELSEDGYGITNRPTEMK